MVGNPNDDDPMIYRNKGTLSLGGVSKSFIAPECGVKIVPPAAVKCLTIGQHNFTFLLSIQNKNIQIKHYNIKGTTHLWRRTPNSSGYKHVTCK